MEEEKKHLVCNDCGCRFEAGAGKERADELEKAPPEPRIECPECKSLNISTA